MIVEKYQNRENHEKRSNAENMENREMMKSRDQNLEIKISKSRISRYVKSEQNIQLLLMLQPLFDEILVQSNVIESNAFSECNNKYTICFVQECCMRRRGFIPEGS